MNNAYFNTALQTNMQGFLVPESKKVGNFFG